jgi:hypothetical protein
MDESSKGPMLPENPCEDGTSEAASSWHPFTCRARGPKQRVRVFSKPNLLHKGRPATPCLFIEQKDFLSLKGIVSRDEYFF